MAVFSIIFGTIWICYDIILICLNPGTFLDNLTAFSHIWAVFGGYHVFLGIFRIKKGKPFYKTWQKWLKILVISVCSAAVFVSGITLCFICNPKTASITDEAKYVILLGGGIDKYGTLPKNVMNRVDAAAEYLNANPEAVCIVTGGTLKWLPYPEAPALKKALNEKGVVNERLLIEDQALDTIQNFENSCTLLAEYSNCSKQEILESPIVVVTSKFHLRRAERLAARMGFTNIKGISADDATFSTIHLYVREICAYLKLNLRILLTGKPEQIK